MAHPNETVVRAFLGAVLRDDMTAAGKMVADDIVWHFAGHSPISGEYAGRDGLSDLSAAYGRMLSDRSAEESLDLHDVVADDDHVVVIWTRTGQRADARFTSHGVGVYHVNEGRITEVWVFHEDQYAFDAFYS